MEYKKVYNSEEIDVVIFFPIYLLYYGIQKAGASRVENVIFAFFG